MTILVYCPLAPTPPIVHDRALASIFALRWMQPADIVFGRADTRKYPDPQSRNTNITAKYNRARDLALSGGYDALLTVESDMIIPPLALERMSRIDADVVYGLYVSRHGKHVWLAFSDLTGREGGKYAGMSFSNDPDLCREAWGSVVETAGVGLGCTLIRRRVLEAIPFRNPDGMVANDWHFALDVKAAGFRQVHDCGVVCGHIGDDVGALGTTANAAYWPTEDGGWRVEG